MGGVRRRPLYAELARENADLGGRLAHALNLLAALAHHADELGDHERARRTRWQIADLETPRVRRERRQ